jgi:PKD repeat protein
MACTAVFTTPDKGSGFGVTSTTVTIANVAPTAVISAPFRAASGLLVTFDESLSGDPGNDILFLAWDFDNDGSFDDGNDVIVTHIFTSTSTLTMRLRVDDSDGGQDVAIRDIEAEEKRRPPLVRQPHQPQARYAAFGGWSCNSSGLMRHPAKSTPSVFCYMRGCAFDC